MDSSLWNLRCSQRNDAAPICKKSDSGILYERVIILCDWIPFRFYSPDDLHADLHKFLILSSISAASVFADAVFLGLIGCTCQYFIAPKWKQVTRKIPLWFLLCVCVLLGMLMLLDVFFAFYR